MANIIKLSDDTPQTNWLQSLAPILSTIGQAVGASMQARDINNKMKAFNADVNTQYPGGTIQTPQIPTTLSPFTGGAGSGNLGTGLFQSPLQQMLFKNFSSPTLQ